MGIKTWELVVPLYKRKKQGVPKDVLLRWPTIHYEAP